VGLVRGAFAALLALGTASPAFAAPVRYGTEAEAKAMAEKAVALYKKEGAAAALAAIGKAPGPFFHRDLYVVVIGPDKKIAADPAEPDLVGADEATLRDSLGKPWALFIEKQATEDGVWIDYEAKNPQTGSIEDKSAFSIRAGDHVFSCGYYRRPPEAAPAAPAAAPANGADPWTGKWDATDTDGAHFTISLDASGSAVSDRGEGQRGFWIVDTSGARIDWTDGRTDYLLPAGSGFERMSFAPGAPRDEKPDSTTPVTREKE